MSTIEPGMTRAELGALVCETLERDGISVVLSGGAVVSIYSDNAYESYDLDMIPTGLARRVDAAMQELGFRKSRSRHWVHPHTRLWVEFPPGPVTVGKLQVTEFSEMQTTYGVLRLLAPTECVMDRLASYYHWGDSQALEQAIAVAHRHWVDLERIREWSCGEQSEDKLADFLERLGDSAAPR
ncbi:MAG: hypothetical protein V3V67_04390 [Myxococcota bacterium]